jgi:hypothetical protein
MQKVLIIIGIVILAIGRMWPWLGRLHPGRLPGNIVIDKPNLKIFTFRLIKTSGSHLSSRFHGDPEKGIIASNRIPLTNTNSITFNMLENYHISKL